MDKIFSKSVLTSFANKVFCTQKILHSPSSAACNVLYLQTRKKHWKPQFQEERRKKVLKVVLPDFDENPFKEKLSLEQIRSVLKEKGIAPHKKWNQKPMLITCTGCIADPYVPPKGDGKMTFVLNQDAKQLFDDMGMKGKSYLALRRIQNLDFNFDLPTLIQKGTEIYIDAQKALAEKNEEKLQDLVTERGLMEMMEFTRLRTIRWNFIQSLEPPRIVHIRCQEMICKESIFAQVTLRLFSQQTLAVYDRFGRLIHGSEDTVKDALEYLVFEKHVTNPNGTWKIHGKIIPESLTNCDTPKSLNQPTDEKFEEVSKSSKESLAD